MKQSELLRKQADMMDMAEKYGIAPHWRRLIMVRQSAAEVWVGFDCTTCIFNLDQYKHHKFALGVVEGKPVFEGDDIYFDGGLIKSITSFYGDESRYSWNPPKPKTVMVELPVEVAEFYATEILGALPPACRKALEELK